AIKFRPAVLHCHLHEGALIGLLVGPLLGAKVIFDSQGGLTDELSRFKMIEKGSLLYGIFLLIEKAIYRLVPTIVASNESNYAMLRDLFKVPETKLRLVPDAISFDIKTDPKVTETLRKEMKIPSDRKVIVYLGSYTEVQNVEAVLKLAEVMKSKRQDIFWVLRGNGDVAHYQNLVQTLKLSDRVYLGDVIPYLDSQSYLALGDFAITLKLRTTESNGKLLSYALARLPIIALDHQSNRSLIGDSACYLGGDGDYEAWSSKLSKYLDLPKSTHEETARQLEKKIKACYAWESIIKKLESIYDGDNI
ncbi:MAG: glycosyltransferase, partial [Candidatus Paceibacterota bacterium]